MRRRGRVRQRLCGWVDDVTSTSTITVVERRGDREHQKTASVYDVAINASLRGWMTREAPVLTWWMTWRAPVHNWRGSNVDALAAGCMATRRG